MKIKLILAVALIVALGVVESEGRRNRRWVEEDENEPEIDDDDQQDSQNLDENDEDDDEDDDKDDDEDDDDDDLVRRSIGQSQSQYPQFPGYPEPDDAGQQTQDQNTGDVEQSGGFDQEQSQPSQNYGEQSQGSTGEQEYLAKEPSSGNYDQESNQNSIDTKEKPLPWWKRWGKSIKGFYKDVKNKVREGRDYNYKDK